MSNVVFCCTYDDFMSVFWLHSVGWIGKLLCTNDTLECLMCLWDSVMRMSEDGVGNNGKQCLSYDVFGSAAVGHQFGT